MEVVGQNERRKPKRNLKRKKSSKGETRIGSFLLAQERSRGGRQKRLANWKKGDTEVTWELRISHVKLMGGWVGRPNFLRQEKVQPKKIAGGAK